MAKKYKKATLKTLSWLAISTIVSFSVALLYLGELKEASGLTILGLLAKCLIYYPHELFWQGKGNPPKRVKK